MLGLRKSTKGTGSLLEDVTDYASFFVDPDGRVIRWSTGAERLLGFGEHEALGISLLTLLSDEPARLRVGEFLGSSSEKGEKLQLECWCTGKGNRKLWGTVNVSGVAGQQGAIEGYSVILHDQSERKKAEDQLRENEVQLRSLAARLQAVREEERTRIARELHDEFGQMLTALRMDLTILERMVSKALPDSVSKMPLFEKMGTISDLLEKTIRSTRRIITELRPAVLDELGLLTAIQWQALEFENRTGIRCRIARLQHDIELSQTASTAVFRILQEALTNVAKHASAANVVISLREMDGNVVMVIQDDGKGMGAEKQKDPTSTGILGIRERVIALSGGFEIESHTGEGTTLKISIPYHPSGPTGVEQNG